MFLLCCCSLVATVHNNWSWVTPKYNKLNLRVLLPMCPQCLQNQSSDIRLVSERVLWWVFKDPETPAIEASLIKPILKSLLDNTKDKNTSVRAQSEYTIVSLLKLRQGEETMQVRLQQKHSANFCTCYCL